MLSIPDSSGRPGGVDYIVYQIQTIEHKRHLIKLPLPMQIHVKFPLFRGATKVLEPNFNDAQWLSTDIRVISPLCIPGLGTGINAAVIL